MDRAPAYVALDDDALSLQIENWARWSRTRTHRQRCRSLRSPQAWDKPATPHAPVDVLAAERMEQAWGRDPELGASAPAQVGLHLPQTALVHPEVTATARIRLHPIDYAYELRRARAMLAWALMTL